MRVITKIRKGWLIVPLISVVFSSSVAIAQDVRQVETNGTIGFTGVYEPIGTPDPAPPETIVRPPITEVAKPEGSLPQTNTVTNHWLIYLGITLLSFVFFIWKRNKKEQTNEN